MRGYTVYKHESPSGKVYIGITGIKPEYRWQEGRGYKGNKHFTRAIEKYGWENFKHEILFSGITKESACEKEVDLIKRYNSTNSDSGYNVSTGGDASRCGVRLSPERKEKISGKNNPMYGRHHSEETKKKISESKKGKPLSMETRAQMSAARKGGRRKPHSEESKKKMSLSHKGQNCGEENPNHGKTGALSIHSKKVVQLSPGDGRLIKIFDSISDAKREMGVDTSSVSKCCKGIYNVAGGYMWKYKNEC